MPGNEYPRVASVAIRELITAQSDTKEIDNRKILESILSRPQAEPMCTP